MSLISRLKEFKERNPDIADAIENSFPETIDDTPFIKVNQFFVKKVGSTGKKYLYQLVYNDTHNKLKIKNLGLDITWKGDAKGTNFNTASTVRDLYLNKFDFNALLNESGTSIHNIAVVPNSKIEKLHDTLLDL